MGQSLKLFRKLSLLIAILPLFAFDCNEEEVVASEAVKQINNKLFIVVDQSASISYKKRATDIKLALSNAFDATYRFVLTPTEYFVSDITTQTNVVAERFPFMEEFPDAASLGGVTFKTKLGQWRIKRNQWINGGMGKIYDRIMTDKKDYTDVYGSLQTLDMIGEDLKPQDTLQVFIFSDMKQSTRKYELVNLLAKNHPESLAKVEAQKVFQEKNIKKLNKRFHCNITIMTPDKFEDSGVVVQYWNQFFKEWGLTTAIKWM